MGVIRTGTQPLRWLQEQVDAEERRLLVQAVVVGVVVWGFVATLKWAVHAGIAFTRERVLESGHVVFVLVPLALGALGVAAVARVRRSVVHYRDAEDKVHPLDTVEGDGLERAIALYFASEPTLDKALLGRQGVEARWRLPTFSLTVRKMLASFCTLVSGGAGGLEASVTLVGESTAAGLFKPRSLPKLTPELVRKPLRPLDRVLEWWRATQPEDLQAAQLCGIAAAISTLLGTPFAAAFFAIEVIYRRRPIIDRLIYALVSALIAFFLNHLVTGAHSAFAAVPVRPPLYVARYYVALFALAVSMGILSTVFRRLRTWADHAFQRHAGRPVARLLTGALITGALAIAAALAIEALALPLPEASRGIQAAWLVLGPGENVIDQALAGELGLWVALLALGARFLATIATITSGGSAGLLFPTLCFGCLVASAWSHVFELDAPFLVIPAMTASLASVANVPLAAILLVIEGFGAQWIVPAMFVLVVASIFAHKNSIYRAQRESFDRDQILPGVSVRRIRVPGAWAGSDLRGLGIRERYGLTVIGMVDRREAVDGTLDERVVLNPSPEQRLTRGDVLIVLGEDDRIERLSRASSELTLGNMPAPRP
jgi:CIC family chloride channel protein